MFQLLAALAALMMTTQSGSTGASSGGRDTPKANPTVMLSGCVSRSNPSRPFTLVDTTSSNRYRLTGKALRKYAGQHVELMGSFGKGGLHIAGGLVPTPNVAAQGGALDPTRAAVAAMSSGMSRSGSDDQLPEFHVTRVRSLDGSCER